MHKAEDIIRRKRDGLALADSEIRAFIEGVSCESVSDAQIAAFTMATWLHATNILSMRANFSSGRARGGSVSDAENASGTPCR